MAWPDVPEAVVDQLRAVGEERRLPAGEVLFDVGQAGYELVWIESGAVDIVDRADDHVVTVIEDGNFVGELGMLLGQGTFLAGVARQDLEAVVVPHDELVRLVATVPEVGDVVVSAFAARRRLLVEWGEGGLVIVGRERDPRTVSLLEFASRNRIPHRVVDADDLDEAGAVLEPCDVDPGVLAHGPVVVTGRARASVQPSTRELAAALGMDLAPATEQVDLVVVGAGPAGLATAVYGASEGLSTLVVEDTAIGGQAGTSSRIENYLGFATGIAGSELAFQGEIQAIKFGARLTTPRRATALAQARDGAGFELLLDDGTTIHGRAVVLACGVRYRRLPLDRLEEFEGAGVYYAATELEARFCRGTTAVVVGGGNSAGQAAMFLSRVADTTEVLVRGDGLAATMSSYLSTRLDRDPAIDVRTHSEVVALHGEEHLEAITVRDDDGDRVVETRALFVMIGARPNTAWLHGVVELDDHGFVVTGGDDREAFATSVPGVYAVGDVRAGSIKRVASAVGEGSVVVSSVHDHVTATADRVP